MKEHTSRHVALVPAAGSGSRIGAPLPKQYLPLAGRPMIAHTLAALCAVDELEKVFVVLSVDDPEWGRHDWSWLGTKLVPLFCGGATRAASVLGGLRAIAGELAQGDWVLVHDAARPCIAPWDVQRLIGELEGDEVGGLLALPVADTLKRADGHGRALETVARERLWQAQTPQMFRHVMLRRALEDAADVTDEAGAIEAAGLHPKLVQGDASNLKVTWPVDLYLAERILEGRLEAAR